MRVILRSHRRLIEVLLFAAIIGLAAFLRMGFPDIVEFKRDEANLSLLALDLARNGNFPLLGIGSSVGIPNAPINVYILALPYMFSTNPMFATQFIGLLNVIAVGMTYVLSRRYTGILAAWIAVLLFAISPWGMIFSRKIWAQNMLPLFVIGTVWSGIAGFIEGRRGWQIVHMPLLAVTLQIHYAAFVLLPITIALVWLGRIHFSRWFSISFLLAGVIMLPFLLGILDAKYKHDLSDVWGSNSKTNLEVSTQAIEGAEIIFSGMDIHSLAGPAEFEHYLSVVPDVYPLFRLITITLFIAVLWLVYRSFRRGNERYRVNIILLVWFLSPLLVFSFTWTPFYIHYLIPIMPAGFLILGFAIDDLLQFSSGRISGVRSFIVGVVGLVMLFQGGLSLALLRFVNVNYTPDGFGTPVHLLMDIRDAIYDQDHTDLIGDVGGQALVFDENPTIWKALVYEFPSIRFVDERTKVYPREEALLLRNRCETNALPQYPLRQGEGCYEIETVSQVGFLPSQISEIDSMLASFHNGVQLVGYHWNNENCLILYWKITQNTMRDYFFAVHFKDEASNLLAQADGLSWFGSYWREGDLVERELCPAGLNEQPSYVDVGMYTHDGTNFFNVDLIDTSGNILGHVYTIDLIR